MTEDSSQAARQVLSSLRAVRRFSTEPVPESVLVKILDIARWTGSARNKQPWALVVIRDRTTLERLSSMGAYARHLELAQVAVVLVIDGPDGDADHAFDEGRLAQNLISAAWSYGVGSCIASLFPRDNQLRAKQLLGVPEGKVVRTAISLGYPSDSDARFLTRSSPNVRAAVPTGRKALDEIVHWELYPRGAPHV